MENNACVTYKGNYSDYVKQKEEKILLQFENYKEQKKRINSMENAIKDLRQWALQADNNKFLEEQSVFNGNWTKWIKLTIGLFLTILIYILH